MFFGYVLSLLLAVLSVIPAIINLSSATGVAPADDKKLSETAYKIESVSITDVSKRIQDVPVFTPDKYK